MNDKENDLLHRVVKPIKVGEKKQEEITEVVKNKKKIDKSTVIFWLLFFLILICLISFILIYVLPRI